jgi:capsular exopolysaccharide synthesis family protein
MPDLNSTLVTLTHPRSQAAEAYRTLRANLSLSCADRPLHTLVVTPAAPDKDKSVPLANLAVVIAQGGQRVILVDANLRHPSLHELFGAPNEHGLVTLLDELDALTAPPLAPVADVERLQLLTSGPLPLDPAAQLDSARMDKVIAALQKQADFVLFDAPPVLAATDAAILGTKVDGVLLIVQAKHTSRDHVQRAKERLEKAHVCVVGVALTHAAVDKSLAY